MGIVGKSILEDWLSSRSWLGSESADPNPEGGRALSEELSDTQMRPPHVTDPVASSTWEFDFGGNDPTSANLCFPPPTWAR